LNNSKQNSSSPFAVLEDAEIVHRIISGQKELYEVIIRRYNPYLYKTGRAYGFNHHDTQDLMQEAYVSAFYKLAQFEHRSAFKTWLIRIFLNYCYHKKNKAGFLKELSIETDLNEESTPQFSTASKTENKIMNKELGHVIEAALSKLKLEYRMVFSLRELNGFSVAETAHTLNISESNVKVRLNRAKTMLRTEIEKTYSPADIYEFNLIYCDQVVHRVMSLIPD
jgi:RNA polymerase sigma-70 factor (ECF subfamily)